MLTYLMTLSVTVKKYFCYLISLAKLFNSVKRLGKKKLCVWIHKYKFNTCCNIDD